MARHFLIFSMVCFSSFGLLGGVNGTVDAQAGGNYNYSTASIDDNNYNNHINSNNNHEDVFEHKTGQTSKSDHEELDDANKVHQLHLIQPTRILKELNIVKRAPSGFTGLRGKKQNELTQNGIDWNSFDWPDSSEQESELGTWQDYSNAWSPNSNGRRFKKAPTAFYGVRGKKFADASNQVNNLEDLMQQLQVERIRDELLQDFIDRIAMSTDYMNAIEKRTPAGFMGMRGKRAMPDFYTKESDNNDDDGGVMVHQAYKRSPPNHMSFYGTRGKKQPFVDFRNKFVGVRGKKNSATTAALSTQSLTQNPEQSSELMSETEQNYDGAALQSRYLVNMFPLFYDTIYKRTPNGFLGMRGKRATNADTAVKSLRFNINDSALY